jgi:hypothetical protein
VPKLFELQEVYSVLAENFVPWTEQWKREGFEEGVRKTLRSFQQVLLKILEARFGPVSEPVRRKVEGIDSVEELAELTSRASSAPDLDSLGLSQPP